jgi:hypothetical protein
VVEWAGAIASSSSVECECRRRMPSLGGSPAGGIIGGHQARGDENRAREIGEAKVVAGADLSRA